MTDADAAGSGLPQASSPIPGDRAKAEGLLEQGLNHHDRGEIAEALAAYQEAERVDPSFALACNNAGMALIDLERYEEAVEELRKALAIDPEHSEAYNNLGFVLRRLHRDVEAAEAYDRFLVLSPDVEEAPRIRQWIETVRPGGPPPAQPAPPPAPVAAPAGAVAEMPAPEAASADGSSEAAMTVERPAARPETVTFSGISAGSRTGHLARVEPEPTERPAAERARAGAGIPAAAVPPAAAPSEPDQQPAENADDLHDQALDKFGDGAFDEARALFERALAVAPEHARSHAGLGKVWIRQGDCDRGIAELNEAIRLDPSDPGSYYVLGYALRSLGDDQRAAEAYEKFLALMPAAEDAEKIREWVDYVRGAAAAQAAGSAADPGAGAAATTEADARYQEALARFQGGDSEGALKDCERILEEHPKHVDTHVLLGRIALRLREYETATEYLQQGLVHDPDCAEAIYFLGQALESRGMRNEALQNYERYLEVAPDGPRADQLRGILQTGQPAAPVEEKGQCALCLRTFDAKDLFPHEGAMGCRECLTTLEAKTGRKILPADAGRAASVKAAPELRLPAQARRARRSPAAAIGIGVVALALAAVGALAGTGRLTPLLQRVGVVRPPPEKKEVPTDDPGKQKPPDPPVKPAFDASRIKITGDPPKEATPWRKFVFEPKIEGAEGIPIQVEMKKPLPGAIVGTDPVSLNWVYRPEDAESLGEGKAFPVEMAIRGVDKNDPKKILFEKTVAFSIRVRFGFSVDEARETGIPKNDEVLLAVGDVTGDGRPDVVAANGWFRRGELRIFPILPMAGWPQPKVIPLGGMPSALALADLNGDGRSDVVAADWYASEIAILLQSRTGGVEPHSRFRTVRGVVGMSAADLTGDGLTDIVVAGTYDPSVNVYPRVPGDKVAFGAAASCRAGQGSPSARLFAWPDVSKPKAVALFGGASPDARIKYFQWAGGAFKTYVGSALEQDAIGLDAAMVRVEAEASPAVAVLCAAPDTELRVLHEHEGTFSKTTKGGIEESVKVNALGYPLRVAAGDLNGDGLDDLAIICSRGVILYVRDMHKYVEAISLDVPSLAGPAAIADLNGDGLGDLIVLAGDHTIRIFQSLK